MSSTTNHDFIEKMRFWILLAGTAAGCVLFIIVPVNEVKKDIALIQQDLNHVKENHIAHIKESLDKESERNDKQDAQLNEMVRKLDKIIYLIGEE